MNFAPAPPASVNTVCPATRCRRTCALDVVDGLLRETDAVRGEEVDSLLDLRSLLRRRENAEATLALFLQLRRSMEQRHYLAFYRLRHWLQNEIQVNVRVRRGELERTCKLKLDCYCIEAVRCQSLRAVLGLNEPVLAPKVSFAFAPLVESGVSCREC
jgi:hypothetical protein